jgi:hypothetical protein
MPHLNYNVRATRQASLLVDFQADLNALYGKLNRPMRGFLGCSATPNFLTLLHFLYRTKDRREFSGFSYS